MVVGKAYLRIMFLDSSSVGFGLTLAAIARYLPTLVTNGSPLFSLRDSKSSRDGVPCLDCRNIYLVRQLIKGA